jgi:hypothetical protein
MNVSFDGRHKLWVSQRQSRLYVQASVASSMKTKEIAIETKARSSGLFGVLLVGCHGFQDCPSQRTIELASLAGIAPFRYR